MPATKHRNPFHAAAGLKVDRIFKANGASDLSTCQYRWVSPGAVEGEIVGATGGCLPYPIGILQNAPAASGNAIVRIFGESQLAVVATACTLRFGDFVSSTGCGAAMYSGASGVVLGRVMSGSVASNGTGSLIVLISTIVPSGSLMAAC